jgi:hypothetical protein
MKFVGVGSVRWKDRHLVNFNTGTAIGDGKFILDVSDPGVIQRLEMLDFEKYTGPEVVHREQVKEPEVNAASVPVAGVVSATDTPAPEESPKAATWNFSPKKQTKKGKKQ